MRNSQIAMLSALGVLLLVVVVLVVGFRMVLFNFADGDFADDAAPGSGRFEPSEALDLSSELTGFRRILIRDNWSVELVRGGDWRVTGALMNVKPF